MPPMIIDSRQLYAPAKCWNRQTLKSAQRTGRYHAEKHPSGIYDGAYGLQKIGDE